MNKKAFTLIELLVVIAIIGLLSTLSIVALNTARARSRDARRISDIKQTQTALEMYYNDNGQYPSTLTGGANLATNSVVYIDIVPKPPIPADHGLCTGTTIYTYNAGVFSGSTNGTYSLNCCLGNQIGNLSAGLVSATPAGLTNYTPAQSGVQPPPGMGGGPWGGGPPPGAGGL
ncbi:MAG: prepilin-type N-terminal cleavage/methylation domain-containing protein [Candidatus Falkowbacteria bacterium]